MLFSHNYNASAKSFMKSELYAITFLQKFNSSLAAYIDES